MKLCCGFKEQFAAVAHRGPEEGRDNRLVILRDHGKSTEAAQPGAANSCVVVVLLLLPVKAELAC